MSLTRREVLPLLLTPAWLAGCRQETATETTKAPEPVVPDGNQPSPDPKAERTSVELLLNWLPEAEHGGYFAASLDPAIRGALDLTLLPGGPSVPVVQSVATGRVPFAVANADQVLTGRAAGADVVAVFAPLQISPRCIVVHEKAGITKLDELSKAKKLAMNANSTFALYLRKKVSLEGCTIVAYSGNVAQFLLDPELAQQGYIFSEPYVAKKKGGDPVSLLVADIGFSPYTSVLITSGETVRTKPDLVRTMAQASRAGWIKYLSEPSTANTRIHELNREMEPDVLQFGVGELTKLCYPEGITDANFGSMTLERWTQLAEQLVECGAIEAGKVKVEEAFNTTFLNS